MQKENSNQATSVSTGSRPTSLPTREGPGGGSRSVLRVYSRSELAQLYYGRLVSDQAARKWFMKELSYVPGLMDRLKALGLTPHGKIFSRAQVAAFFEALGEP